MDVCDPSVDLKTLREMVRQDTGLDVKLTKNQICQVYKDVQENMLPLPPLVMSSDRTYLVDSKSPLSVKDYEKLFNSKSTVKDIKRILKKIDGILPQLVTKENMLNSIKNRLKSMNVREPIKITSVRKLVKVDYGSAMENVINNGNVKNNRNNTRNNVNNMRNNRNNTRNNVNNLRNNRNNAPNTNVPKTNDRPVPSPIESAPPIRFPKALNIGMRPIEQVQRPIQYKEVSTPVFFPKSMFGSGVPRFVGGPGLNARRTNITPEYLQERDKFRKLVFNEDMKIQQRKQNFERKQFEEFQKLTNQKKNFERKMAETRFKNEQEKQEFKRLMEQRFANIDKKSKELENEKRIFMETFRKQQLNLNAKKKQLNARIQPRTNIRPKVNNTTPNMNNIRPKVNNNRPKVNNNRPKTNINQNAIKQVRSKLGFFERGKYIKRLEAGENSATVLSEVNALLNQRRQKKEEENEKRRLNKERENERISRINQNAIKQVRSKLGMFERGKYIKRLEAGENSATVLSEVNALLNQRRQKKEEENEKRRLNKERENERISRINQNAIRKIRNMRELGFFEKRKFVKRLESGENSSTVLNNASRIVNKRRENAQRPTMNKDVNMKENQLTPVNIKENTPKPSNNKFKTTKNTAAKLQAMTALGRENRKRLMNRLSKGETPETILADAQKLTSTKQKDSKVQNIKNVSSKLQAMPSLTRENRKRLMNRLSKGTDKESVLNEARRLAFSKMKDEAAKKPVETKQTPAQWKNALTERRIAKEKETKLQAIKNTSARLQAMVNLTRENRKRFMDRVSRGEAAGMILANAQKLVTNRKIAEEKEMKRKIADKKSELAGRLRVAAKRSVAQNIQKSDIGVKNQMKMLQDLKLKKTRALNVQSRLKAKTAQVARYRATKR